jgi:hypothetical protein
LTPPTSGRGQLPVDVDGPVRAVRDGEGAVLVAVGLIGEDPVLVVQVGDAPGGGCEAPSRSSTSTA